MATPSSRDMELKRLSSTYLPQNVRAKLEALARAADVAGKAAGGYRGKTPKFLSQLDDSIGKSLVDPFSSAQYKTALIAEQDPKTLREYEGLHKDAVDNIKGLEREFTQFKAQQLQAFRDQGMDYKRAKNAVKSLVAPVSVDGKKNKQYFDKKTGKTNPASSSDYAKLPPFLKKYHDAKLKEGELRQEYLGTPGKKDGKTYKNYTGNYALSEIVGAVDQSRQEKIQKASGPVDDSPMNQVPEVIAYRKALAEASSQAWDQFKGSSDFDKAFQSWSGEIGRQKEFRSGLKAGEGQETVYNDLFGSREGQGQTATDVSTPGQPRETNVQMDQTKDGVKYTNQATGQAITQEMIDSGKTGDQYEVKMTPDGPKYVDTNTGKELDASEVTSDVLKQGGVFRGDFGAVQLGIGVDPDGNPVYQNIINLPGSESEEKTDEELQENLSQWADPQKWRDYLGRGEQTEGNQPGVGVNPPGTGSQSGQAGAGTPGTGTGATGAGTGDLQYKEGMSWDQMLAQQLGGQNVVIDQLYEEFGPDVQRELSKYMEVMGVNRDRALQDFKRASDWEKKQYDTFTPREREQLQINLAKGGALESGRGLRAVERLKTQRRDELLQSQGTRELGKQRTLEDLTRGAVDYQEGAQKRLDEAVMGEYSNRLDVQSDLMNDEYKRYNDYMTTQQEAGMNSVSFNEWLQKPSAEKLYGMQGQAVQEQGENRPTYQVGGQLVESGAAATGQQPSGVSGAPTGQYTQDQLEAQNRALFRPGENYITGENFQQGYTPGYLQYDQPKYRFQNYAPVDYIKNEGMPGITLPGGQQQDYGTGTTPQIPGGGGAYSQPVARPGPTLQRPPSYDQPNIGLPVEPSKQQQDYGTGTTPQIPSGGGGTATAYPGGDQNYIGLPEYNQPKRKPAPTPSSYVNTRAY